MKKILSSIIVFCFTSINLCYAESALYYLKNIKTDNLKPLVENELYNQGFNIMKNNPYYAVSQNGNDIVVIVLQQSGENMFYYYQSDNNSRINKNILKEVKKQNIICEQSFNTSIIDIYDNIAKQTIATSGAGKKYSFEEENENIFTPPKTTSQQNTSYQGYVAQLGIGTKLDVYLQNAINTATATKGDSVSAVLMHDLTYNGITVAPQGSVLYGSLSKARNATYGSRNGRVVLSFNQLVTPENKVYSISTEEIDFTVSNEGKIAESAKTAVRNAALGAVTGLIFALLTDRNVGQAMAVGAGVGAGSSVIYSTAERGVDAEIPSFTEMELTLSKPLSVSVNY